MKEREFGVKGPEVTIIGQGTWHIDRGDRKSAEAVFAIPKSALAPFGPSDVRFESAIRRIADLGQAALTNFDYEYTP